MGEWGIDWEFGVSRYKLLHTEWINNKVLLYSTGNFIQYLVINRNGKEYKKSVYMCITEACISFRIKKEIKLYSLK